MEHVGSSRRLHFTHMIYLAMFIMKHWNRTNGGEVAGHLLVGVVAVTKRDRFKRRKMGWLLTSMQTMSRNRHLPFHPRLAILSSSLSRQSLEETTANCSHECSPTIDIKRDTSKNKDTRRECKMVKLIRRES